MLNDIKEVTDSDEESDYDEESDSEEEEVKFNVTAISEEVFLTWENPKAKGGKKAFIESEVKKARNLLRLENRDKV